MTTEKVLTNFPGQPYVLNSTDSVIPVNVAPKGTAAHWIHIRLRRPKREELLEREEATATLMRPKGGETLIVSDNWGPNVTLGAAIAVEVSGLEEDESQFVPARQAQLEKGWLDKAVKGYYAQAARLLWDRSLLRKDTNPNTVLRVRHEFGTGELPDYVIHWQFRKPDEITQGDYRINSQKISTGSGGRRAESKFITDLTVAERTFDEIFVGVEGAVIAVEQAGGEGFELITYTEERREEFLAAIDPIIKRAAVEPVMEWLEGQLSD